MKARLLVAVVLLSGAFLLLTSLQAQNIPADTGMLATNSYNMAAVNTEQIALSGKVSIEGGADITKDVVVVLDCGFGARARTNVDSKGHFTLMLGNRGSLGEASQDASPATAALTGCTLRGEAPGYRSSTLDLQGHQSGVIEVGTIVMSPLVQTPGAPTVSVVSLAAPDKARKEFVKGQAQAKKGRWAAACDSFRKAIQVYPRYALAWLELGRAQLHQNNVNEAQQSFVSATTQDSRLLPAYVELAHVEAAQQQWTAMARTTANLVELAPESSAAFWFLDSVANYNLQNRKRAETSAERGLRLDAAHQVPQLEYLYGLILASKQDYGSAIKHIRSYLQLSPGAEDASDAKRRLAEFEKLASTQAAQLAR